MADVAIRIHAKGYTDNVVDLMVGKLGRLPIKAQEALQQLACLGNRAEFARLAKVREGSKEELDRDLEEALRAGLVFASGNSYRLPSRSRSGSRLFADPGRTTFRSASSNWEVDDGEHPSREARGGDLRDRQPAQSRRCSDHDAW
jgi:hypothetical protein